MYTYNENIIYDKYVYICMNLTLLQKQKHNN